MEKVTITRVQADDKKRDGTPLIGKFGKPYFKVGIQTNEYGDTWINGFLPFNPDRWVGSTQEIEIYEEEYQGKTYKKFKLPPRAGAMSPDIMPKLEQILREVTAIRTELVMVRQTKDAPKVDYPESAGPTEFDDEELPNTD